MIRYKPVPRPRDRDLLWAARDALPLVPADAAACRARIGERTAVDPDRAREWLAFLVALELAARTDGGYRRTRADPDEAALREQFLSNVLGARELLAAIGDGADDAEAALDAVREAAPPWERHRRADWERAWLDRTRRLLGWADVLGVVSATEDGYSVAVPSAPDPRSVRR